MMHVKLTTGRSAFALTLTGSLDGPVPWPAFDKLKDGVRGGMVVVDVGGVVDVSPRGLQALLRGFGAVPAERRLLVNVRPALLSAMALCPGVVDVVGVGSAFLPLVCARCRTAHEQLMDLRLHEAAARAFAVPGFRCPSCGGPCALDDDPLVLLAPFAEQPPLSLPDGIEAFWPPPRASASSRAQVEIDVAPHEIPVDDDGADDDVAVTAVWIAGTLSPVPSLSRLARQLAGNVVFVCDDVHSTTSAGLDALRDLLGALPSPWVARLSPVLAQGVATTLNGWGNAAVASMRLPFRCASCDDTVLVDVGVAERSQLAHGQTPPCPRCATALSQAFTERDLMTLHTMPLQQPPPAVAAYLETHAHPPSHDRQSQWTQVMVAEAVGVTAPTRAAAPASLTTMPLSAAPGASAGVSSGVPSFLASSSGPALRAPPALEPSTRADTEGRIGSSLKSVGAAKGSGASPAANVSGNVTANVSGNVAGNVDGAALKGAARTATKQTSAATRYEVLRRLGVGGMAETLLGRQTGIGGFEKRVVIKRILPALAQKADFVDMFLHEARVAARINHSNVVQIFDFGRAKGEYYIVMEYVKGFDLAAVMKEAQRVGRQVPLELAIRVVCDLCAGLSAAHTARDEAGNVDAIIHRDVSPHNVLISTDGATKLADFGIAKPQSLVGVTRPGELKGKIVYMAPEALRNDPPTIKVDIYAAGLILYTLLAGKNPYTRASEVQSMYAVAHEGLPPIISARRDVPFALAATLGRAVNRDPAARFPSAQALQLHLEAFLGELGRPATQMHVALWMNELMARSQDKPAPVEGTPSSSLELLEIGALTTGGGELRSMVLEDDGGERGTHVQGMMVSDDDDERSR